MRIAALLLAAWPLLAAEDAPAWVREAAARPVPSYPAKVSLVVTLQEESVTVNADGSRIMRERGALRVLQQLSHPPVAQRGYDSRNGRIRSFQGWLLSPSGKPVVFGKNAIVDRSAATSQMYDEHRYQALNPGTGLAPGATFAWEVVEEEKTIFANYHYPFQSDDPVLLSRFTLTLPAGWEVKSVVLNHAPIEPRVEGSVYSWELRDLPWIEPEEHSPGIAAAAPRLGVSYFPASGGSGLRTAKDWGALSAWFSELADPAAEASAPVRAKAAELTAGAKTALDKMRALAAFVQQTNYVFVAIDLNHGGGFTPHRAEQTLERNYGDCKDKTALMRALLASIGVESYAVSIYATDRLFVRPEWPASQFNHDITAIRAPAELTLPATLDHPRLGRLLLFDPTSRTTPLGDLPDHEQGSLALVLAGARGELVRTPLLPPALRRVESDVEARLTPEGGLTARISRRYFGQSAGPWRRLLLGEPEEFKHSLERALSRHLGGLTLGRVEHSDRFEEGQLELKMDVAVNRFGQIMQGRLLIVNPGDLAPPPDYALPAKPRQQPVELYARAHTDSVKIAVPPRFKVDELPEPLTLESPYGSFHARWRAEGASVLFEQSVEIKDTLAPASEYGQVREFLEKIATGQRSPVVLVKE